MVQRGQTSQRRRFLALTLVCCLHQLSTAREVRGPHRDQGISRPNPTSALPNYTTVLDPGSSFGPWEGWGTSLSWWANVFGQRDDLADVFFTLNSVTVNGAQLPGLGLNVVRYNAGGCSTRTYSGASMVASPNIPSFKQIGGFWEDWASEDPSSPSWNWSADERQVAMLKKAFARGANLAELFSNSPMWWQCANHNPSGAEDGHSDNLEAWNHQQHAIYLASVAERAATNWGIPFDSVEPFNEPSASWWKADGSQEGCHFNQSTQAAIVPLLRAELDRRGLGRTVVAASDENSYTEALATWSSFNSATQASVGRVNVHGYEQNHGPRDALKQAVGEKRLWNSEYGDGDSTGLSLATNLNLDFRLLKITAWVYWQAVDQAGWGLLMGDLQAGHVSTANPKYFVLAHYTRHIRPGMTIVDGGEPNTVAAYSHEKGRLVLVTTNYDTEQWITYDVSKVPGARGSVTRWSTQVNGGETYSMHQDLTVGPAGLFTVHFPADTVQTFELSCSGVNTYV